MTSEANDVLIVSLLMRRVGRCSIQAGDNLRTLALILIGGFSHYCQRCILTSVRWWEGPTTAVHEED